jgi:hypothetical protein
VGYAEWPPADEVLQSDGVSMRFRVPQVGDLLSLTSSHDEAAIKQALLHACIIEARNKREEAIGAEGITDAALEALSIRMSELDPQADVVVSFSCPHCSAASCQLFDIAGVLVKEVNNWAKRMLKDIHTLAMAYGWSEEHILALGPVRRQAYLDMVRP